MQQDIDALTERFDQSLFVLMQNLGPHLIHRAKLGLTPGQVFMLHFIQREHQCRVTKLAEMMEVAPSAITVMLDRLENHGFVVRTRDKDDRRAVIIQLTDAGKRELNKILEVRKQLVQHCLSQLEPNELASFIQNLEKAASIAQTMDLATVIQTGKGVEA